jgi:hypothetical protein
MRAMRFGFLAAIACATAMATARCNDSNTMTSPGPAATGADVAGSWSGDFQSDNPSLCSGSAATASFTQTGNVVTGSFQATGCGIDGTFRGQVDGTHLSGSVNMMGCTGGAVSGTLTSAGLTITIDEFKKPLVTGDRPVYPGGTASFSRR